VNKVHAELHHLFQLDERRRRDLYVWPLNNQSEIIVKLNKEVIVPYYATSPLLEMPMRSNNDKCLHLLCRNNASNAFTVGEKGTLAVRILLTCGLSVDVNASTDSGDTALHLAARSGANDLIQLLLYHGANAKARNNVLETPIFSAVHRGYLSTMILLFRLGGNRIEMLKDANDRGLTLLHIAAYSQYNLMVEQLVQWVQLGSQYKVVDRSDELEQDYQNGNTMVSRSRKTGCFRSVLAVEGASHSVSNHYYTTVAEQGRLNMGCGGWKDKKMQRKRQALQTLPRELSAATALDREQDREQQLLQHQDLQRQIISAVTKRGVTPLMCACYQQDLDLMGLLSACMSTKELAALDVDGRSASDYARRSVDNDNYDGNDDNDNNTTCSGSKTIIVVDPMI
jgi:ankyrin repeat protein